MIELQIELENDKKKTWVLAGLYKTTEQAFEAWKEHESLGVQAFRMSKGGLPPNPYLAGYQRAVLDQLQGAFAKMFKYDKGQFVQDEKGSIPLYFKPEFRNL